MTLVTAQLNNYRQSPRKVRLVADAVRGKKVEKALTNLAFTPKRATLALVKLIESAVSNATNNHGLTVDSLVIKEIRVDGGPILYRRMPRARGSAYPIRKRTSRVRVVLESRADESKRITTKANAKKTN